MQALIGKNRDCNSTIQSRSEVINNKNQQTGTLSLKGHFEYGALEAS